MTGITGRAYLEAGQPVTVVAQWATACQTAPAAAPVAWLRPPERAPRNVLIRRRGGALVVRPFRGCGPPARAPRADPLRSPHGGTR